MLRVFSSEAMVTLTSRRRAGAGCPAAAARGRTPLHPSPAGTE
jgi:hypothetical protein